MKHPDDEAAASEPFLESAENDEIPARNRHTRAHTSSLWITTILFVLYIPLLLGYYTLYGRINAIRANNPALMPSGLPHRLEHFAVSTADV